MGFFDIFKKKNNKTTINANNSGESLNNGAINEVLIEQFKQKSKRKAVNFQTGGIRPTHQIGESWIGNVCWQMPGESQPLSKNGEPMIPIATIFVPESDYVPKALEGIKMISIFLDIDWLECFDRSKLRDLFVIRTYESLDGLVPCNYSNKEHISPFPLVPNYIDDELPSWSSLSFEEYDYLESIGVDMDNYDELIFEYSDYIMHKLGGYPDPIQSAVTFDKGYEFVMQIYSDEKAGFNIVDNGNFYFGYNPNTKDWSIKCDFY